MRLVVESVSKTYRGNVEALRSFGLTLGPGILGLLGPNGAGNGMNPHCSRDSSWGCCGYRQPCIDLGLIKVGL